jgi:hypothetical protein
MWRRRRTAAGGRGLCGPRAENSAGAAPARTVAAQLLEEFLRGGVEAGRDDQAADTADVVTAAKARRQPGQPVPVGLLVVVQERDDAAGGGRDPGVAGPGQPGPGLGHVAHRRAARAGQGQVPDGAVGGGVVHYDNLERRVLLLAEGLQAGPEPGRAAAGAHHGADEWGRVERGGAAPQERPGGGVRPQAGPGEPGRHRPARRREPGRDLLTDPGPQECAELVRGQPSRPERDHAHPGRLGVQPAEDPGPPGPPGAADGRQRRGQFGVKHQDRRGPAGARPGPVLAGGLQRRSHQPGPRCWPAATGAPAASPSLA